MKITRLERIYAVTLAVIFGGIVVHAPLSVWLGSLFPHELLLIKSWKEILMLALIPVAIIVVQRRQLWKTLWNDWLFRLVALYGALHIVLIPWQYAGLQVMAAGLAIDLRYLLFFGLVYVLVKIQPVWRTRLLIVGAIGAAVVVVFGTLQLFLPADILSHIGYSRTTISPYLTVDKNPNYIRINSTLRGPNPLGAYVVMVLSLMAAVLTRARYWLKSATWRWGFLVMALCSCVVLWISYSRSALVAAVVALGLIAMIVYGRRLTGRGWVVIGMMALIVVAGVVAVRGSNVVANVVLHNNPTTGPAETSNAGHVSSLINGTRDMLQRPLGNGIGSTGSASLLGPSPMIVENQYLFVAHEVGWLGLGLFVAIFVIILLRLWRQRQDWLSLGVFASGVGLALIGLLLPVWADDTIGIVWWGFAAIALAGGEYARKQTK